MRGGGGEKGEKHKSITYPKSSCSESDCDRENFVGGTSRPVVKIPEHHTRETRTSPHQLGAQRIIRREVGDTEITVHDFIFLKIT